jgi:hypothetical protein
MATEKQRAAAKRNVKKAQAAAKSKQTLKNLPSNTRSALGKEAAAVRRGDAPTATSSCRRRAAWTSTGVRRWARRNSSAR